VDDDNGERQLIGNFSTVRRRMTAPPVRTEPTLAAVLALIRSYQSSSSAVIRVKSF